MFYSQFILAKKGPLGTIWIAAHLERKLRKNQVADTDIGVSVDSILFPDVPIALRLSSHLLLGVVRIYSRKVNYLFDDCSDALLKIKQAFRSTAVDLPPEESTAPYHSITLPETFDLDDFELPDNDIFQGNYVDHHISTKEQITLQDTMEGVVYSTSQFGLDERFGDGDTSQIGLDLAEDLFLHKLAAPGHVEVMLNSEADPQTSFQPITPFEEDENNEEMNETSQGMAAGISGNQDYAEAPSTPGLVEEPNLSNVQKALACDDHLETEDHNSTDLEAIENVGTASSKSHHHGDKHDLQMTPHGIPVEDNIYDIGRCEIQHLKPKGDLLTTENVEHLQNGVLSNNEAGVDLRGVGWDRTVSSPSSSHGAFKEDNCHTPCFGVEIIPEKFSSSSTQLTVAEGIPENNQALLPEISSNVEISKNVEESCTPSNALAPNALYPLEPDGPQANIEDQVRHEPKDCKTQDRDKEMPSTHVYVLHPCNSDLIQSKKLSLGVDSSVAPSDLPNDIEWQCSLETSGMEEAIHACGVSAEMHGEECHPIAAVKPSSEENVMSEPNLTDDIEVDRSYLDTVSKDTLDFPDSSAVFELPAPEKLLSMPEGPSNLLNDLLVETTPDKAALEESEEDVTRIRGKKRSFTESTLTLQSLNSNESFVKPQSKQTAEFIPDDDDLLSSILVGRRSSILKMKPTPTPSEVLPLKRPRTAARVSASKRKVLMDDSMVLHGDTIREQLTSTEDIRRVRKKAPSTRHEIWIIQKQFLEDKLFSEPISTGMSIELIGLHNKTYNLSSIRNFLDENIASLDSAKDMESAMRPNVIKENETEGTETSVVRIDGEVQRAGILVHTENQQGEDNFLESHENGTQLQMDAILADIEVKTSNHGEIAEMEIERGSVEVADAAECAPGVESLCPTGPVSDVSVPMHASCLPPDLELDFQSVDKDTSILDLSNGKRIDDVNVGEIHIDGILGFETESGARGDYLLNGAEVGEILEVIADSCTGSSGPTNNADLSITTMSPETGGCKDLIVASNNQSTEEIAKVEPECVKEHEVIDSEVGYDDKNPASNRMSCEEPKADSSYFVECNVNNTSFDGGETAFFNDVERPSYLEAEAHGIMDPEITGLDHHVIEDHGDMENIIVEHDTEFLNVDDDDVAEEDDNYMPSAEETRFLENSGWSSRSRAVAKYLQTLFDKEAELGKKVIPMDNLLSGKTRKEASRMFFETLVLKTRDYIHVEQQNPFNNINIKPRGKLMKSDF